jgi:protocatechuate 3,4-dioxygenase beta subunit
MNAPNSVHSIGLVFTAGLSVLVTALASAAPMPTAEVTEGPFYPFNSSNTLPEIPPANRDNDLTRITGAAAPAQGIPFLLSGVVRDLNGAPVSDAKVEIWQTDAAGVYYHSGDGSKPRDANFQFYGESVTGKDGRYSFRTVKPGLYTGRIRHFHFKVKRAGTTVLTSQFTFDDERADFQKDGVQRRLSADALESTVIAPKRGTDATGADALVAVKDIIIDPNTRSSADRSKTAGARPSSSGTTK